MTKDESPKTVKKVVVLGASGQLAFCIHDVVSKKMPDADFMFYGHDTCDITKSNEVNTQLELNKPRYVINCAAYTNAEKAEFTAEGSKLAYEVNTIGALNVANECKNVGAKLIHISTDYVFDGKKGCYKENDECMPINVYGRSKFLGEEAIRNTMDKRSFLIIRTSWLFSKYSKNSFTTMANNILNGTEVFAFSDQIGCPTYSMDLAEFIVDIVDKDKVFPEDGICQYTNLGVASRYDIAKQIEMFYGAEKGLAMPMQTTTSEFVVSRPQVCIMSNEVASKLGKTRYWVDALKEFLTEYRKKITNEKPRQ